MGVSRRGFTLIEMLVTVSIIAIFMTGVILAVQKANSMTDSYTQVVAVDQLMTIQQGMEIYRRLYGVVPDRTSDMTERMILVGSAEGKDGSHFEITKEKGTAEPVIVEYNGQRHNIADILVKAGYKSTEQQGN